jgi:hypothetical protein
MTPLVSNQCLENLQQHLQLLVADHPRHGAGALDPLAPHRRQLGQALFQRRRIDGRHVDKRIADHALLGWQPVGDGQSPVNRRLNKEMSPVSLWIIPIEPAMG